MSSAKQSKVPAKKASAKAQPVSSTSSGPRRLKVPRHQFRVRGRIKPAHPPIPNAFRIFGRCLRVLQKHWQLFAWLLVVYALLDIVFVRGLSGGLDLASIKSSLSHTSSSSKSLSTGLTLFVYLLGNGNSSSSSSANAGVFQTILLIVVSLAIIWALRQVYAGAAIRMREAFYRGMYPLVPFILVLVVIGLQLLPLLIGGTLYSIVISNGIAVGAFEELLWALLFLVLALVSLYMLCSSVFALYVATLPDMTPMKALRSARELVRHRRWLVLRKILFLPIALLVLAAIIMVPLILFVTPVAGWIFLLLSLVGLVVIHSYMYALYRELLNE